MQNLSSPVIILASQSPYRRELLARLNLQFDCQAPTADEDELKDAYLRKNLTPLQIAQNLAKEKCLSVFKNNPHALVIGSDQLVEFEGQILGKPHNLEKAILQLSSLQGKNHRLITAVAIQDKNSLKEFVDITTLTMRPLDENEIKRYLELDEPYDCAGSYKIESAGISLFEHIDARDFTSIIGLPLMDLSKRLREYGLCVP